LPNKQKAKHYNIIVTTLVNFLGLLPIPNWNYSDSSLFDNNHHMIPGIFNCILSCLCVNETLAYNYPYSSLHAPVLCMSFYSLLLFGDPLIDASVMSNNYINSSAAAVNP